MPVVPGVLLDHVDEDPAQRDASLAVPGRMGLAAAPRPHPGRAAPRPCPGPAHPLGPQTPQLVAGVIGRGAPLPRVGVPAPRWPTARVPYTATSVNQPSSTQAMCLSMPPSVMVPVAAPPCSCRHSPRATSTRSVPAGSREPAVSVARLARLVRWFRPPPGLSASRPRHARSPRCSQLLEPKWAVAAHGPPAR